MAYVGISGLPTAIPKNAGGAAASGYYLKGYDAGTTTPLSMGVDSTPTSTLAKCKLNTLGIPISNDADDDSVFVPHFNASYKIILYLNATDADNNTTANAVWEVDSLAGPFDATQITYTSNATVSQRLDNLDVADYAAIRALTSSQLADGDTVNVTNDGIAGQFVVKTGTVTDNGGTLIVFTDDSNRYVERSNVSNAINVLWFGVTEAASSNTAAYNSAVAAGFKYIYVPDGTYAGSLTLGNNQVLQGSTAKNGAELIPPPGGTFVLKIDATTSARQHCQVLNISLRNPSAVANCDGLVFEGVDKNDINDQHSINNMFIKDFRYGISVTGRQILCTYRNIEVEECEIGMNVVCDAVNYAYNLNTFISCKFATCTKQGIKITGFNTANTFISLNVEGNNTLQVAGVAGMEVENAEGISLINPYFELNGASMAVDTVDETNNGMGLKLTGTRCFNLKVGGGSGWMVQSGVVIYIAPTVTCWGGMIENIRFLPDTGGWSLFCDGAGLSDRPSLCFDSSNYNSGTLEIAEQGTGQYGAHVRQSSTSHYLTAAATLDLLGASKFTCNNASGFTISTVNNRVPGCEMWVHNRGAGTITIDSALMADSKAVYITQGQAKAFLVAGFPDGGEFVPINVAPTTATTAEFADITSDVNISGKYQGTTIPDTTTNLIMTATGSSAGSTWQPSDGGTVTTPV